MSASTSLPVLTLDESCTSITAHLATSVDAVSTFLDGDTRTGPVNATLGPLRTDGVQGPDEVQAPLQAYISAVVDMVSSLTTTGKASGDKVSDEASALLGFCTSGGASADPTEDPTEEPSEPAAPELTKAEKKYVHERVYSDPGDDDYDSDVKDALKTGRSACDKIGEHDAGWSRSRYIYDRNANEYDAYDAVKYLCPKFNDDLKMAKRSIFFENNDVGNGKDKLRPGTYRTAPKVSDCYWSRVGRGGNIIANDFVDYAPGGVTVTVRSSDSGFKTSGDCGPFYPTAKP